MIYINSFFHYWIINSQLYSFIYCVPDTVLSTLHALIHWILSIHYNEKTSVSKVLHLVSNRAGNWTQSFCSRIYVLDSYPQQPSFNFSLGGSILLTYCWILPPKILIFFLAINRLVWTIIFLFVCACYLCQVLELVSC